MRACPGKRQRRGLNGVLRCHKIDLDTLNYLGTRVPSPHTHRYTHPHHTPHVYNIHTYITCITQYICNKCINNIHTCIYLYHVFYTYIHVLYIIAVQHAHVQIIQYIYVMYNTTYTYITQQMFIYTIQTCYTYRCIDLTEVPIRRL